MLEKAYVSISNLAGELCFQFWTYIQRVIIEAAVFQVAGWEWHCGLREQYALGRENALTYDVWILCILVKKT